MRSPALRFAVFSLFIIACPLGAMSQTSPKPLHASQVIALVAGNALPANVVHDIGVRGLNFHPNAEYDAQLTKAGADATVLAALHAAKVADPAVDAERDKELLDQLGSAGGLMRAKRYDDAVAPLKAALEGSFAGPEAGFVMGELLRQKEQWPRAAEVYAEILHEDPDFPNVHTKASYILYRLGDSDEGLNETKTALVLNPNDPEAHKNAGLMLDDARKVEAAIAEYKEALRIKPDYTAVHYDLGLLFNHMHDYDHSIAEYKKAIALDPNNPDQHSNLGVSYQEKGDLVSAIREFGEAKRLDPNDPMVRQNLASALMSGNPHAAIAELKELEKMFPNFEMCHICLGKGLAWDGDEAGAEAEFMKAEQIDPSNWEARTGLGHIRESKKDYDGALDEFRAAERLGADEAKTHVDVARILLLQKSVAGAVAELKAAVALAPSDWHIHELYAQSLQASGADDAALTELKEAVSLDPKQPHPLLELGTAFEKQGDWASALEQYRRAALAETTVQRSHQMGESYPVGPGAPKAYHEAQARFADHLRELRASGKQGAADDLEKRVQAMATARPLADKIEAVLKTGDQAIKDRRYENAKKSFTQAVQMAEQLPAGSELLITSLGRLGDADGWLHDFTGSETNYRRELAVAEQAFGAASPKLTTPLYSLGALFTYLKDYASGGKYYSRALAINEGIYGENSSITAESLRTMAGMYMIQGSNDKAEAYLLRAVKADEATGDDLQVLMPLWGLCSLYEQWEKPDKSQPCWHKANGIMAKESGETSPDLIPGLTKEAQALTQLGRKDEAAQLQQRADSIQKLAAATK